ncbi:Neopentalenolactone D synthase [Aspergillus granulosus]|uniref:Neopentalenolactone D synthase n=1 Tax=Aspergillus granulosus TaxID=176169 RepID=A0ABR4HCX6_9EURO
MNGTSGAAALQPLPFDPAALRKKYDEERDKRLAYGRGINQYKYADGNLAGYLHDPWAGPDVEREPVDEDIDALVIGGGYGAQLVVIRLLEAGLKNIRMVEKAAGFGGTWYWNRYPGAQCDVESYIYMPLLEELNYIPTEKYAHADELLEHADRIARRWNMYEMMLFRTEVHTLEWEEERRLWIAKTNRGDKIRCQFVIPAAGPLHRPKLPGLPGITSFKGHSFHTARWDYNYTGGNNKGGLDKLKDKRVGIIGTGATAVQIVPYLAKSAKELYVFQRTPSSIDVRGNRPTDPKWAASLKPGWQQRRQDNFNLITVGGIADEDLVQDAWTDIGHKLLAGTRMGDKDDSIAVQKQLADYQKMEEIRARCDELVEGKAVAAALKPWYNQLCKRPCFHDQYLQSFNLANVHLVDTQGRGVDEITPDGIRANGEEFPLDCIIYATGFELATNFTHKARLEIYGRGGVSLSQRWKDGISSLHGWTTRDFPNCFWIMHNQATASFNWLYITATQARHIAYVIREARARGIRTIEPTEEAEKNWVDTIVKMAELQRPFFEACTPGYYNNEGTPDLAVARAATYGAGNIKFLELMQQWRDDGKLEGLDLQPVTA